MTALFPRFQGLARKSLARVFYRYFYLREHPLSRMIRRFAPGPQQPDKDIWDFEYNQGYWEKLYDISEQAHYAVLLSYVLHVAREPTVLDVGCGEGLFLHRLQPNGYRRYVGIDFSESAIAKCPQPRIGRTILVSANAEEYVPDCSFDVIVFCESIYYFKNPIDAVIRYAKYLKEDGAFAISLHGHLRTEAIRSSLKRRLSLVHETTITNSGGTWFCLLMKPIENRSGT